MSSVLWLMPQQPAEAPPPPAAALITGFAQLDQDQKNRVLGAIERRVQLHADATIQRIVSMQKGLAAYPALTPLQYFPPQQYAANAPARRLLAASAPEHQRVAANFPPPPFLDDLACGVVFDWNTGKAALAPQQPTVDERFANLAHGYLPGSDQAVAQILQTLVGDPAQHPPTPFFEHLYADRDGRVFAGIRLYDAWYSGKLVEVPDVDAIAFARQLLHTGSFVSPIPDDRRRERLYQRIQDAALQERKFRTLRQAAAAAFVAAAPKIDPAYQPLIDRFHYLWPATGYDVGAVATKIAASKDREELLAEVDQDIDRDRNAWQLREADKLALRNVDLFLRRLCEYELQQVVK